MRVYEFARQKGMKSKEILDICQELGIDVKAQSKFNIEQLEILNRHFSTKDGEKSKLESSKKSKLESSKKSELESSKKSELESSKKSESESSKKSKSKVSKNLESELEATTISKDVAYIVSECEPFTNLGELGKRPLDFIKQTQKEGNKPVIILPRYSFINEELEHLMDVSFKMGNEKRQASLSRLVKNGVTYFFVGDEFYFNRENIYGYEDDVARFTFFNRAILAFLPLIGRPIYDFYLNDWQTSIFALLLKVGYSSHPYYSQIKTILNIHDLSYQGWCEVNYSSSVLGIGEEHYNNGLIRMGNSVNLLKSGIETADSINLTNLSEKQMKCSEMVESGISAVLERNLKVKSA